MELSEKIETKETELTEAKDALVEATKALEAAPDEESLLVQVEELTTKVEDQAKTLAALKKAEKALLDRAKPPEGAPALIKHKFEIKEPGDLIMKHAVVDLLSFIQRRPAQDVLAERYPDINEVKESYDFVTKAQVNPAMTTVTGFAKELVQSDVRGFIASLESVSVAAALAQYAPMINFDGFQSVTIPVENAGAATPTEPAWVAEGSPIPLTQFSYGSMVLNRYKLAAITTFTREIAERSTPQIEGLLRSALQKAYAKVLDQALLSNAAAVANVRPAGLLQGLTLVTGTAGGGDAAVRKDILTLLSAMTGAQLGSKPVLIMNNLDRLAVSMMTSSMSEYMFRDELASGQLLGIPVISSANVAQHTLVLVDADALALAFDTPMFDASDVATVVEASADANPPTMASTAAGAAGTAGQVGPTDGIPVNEDGRPAGTADAGFKARSLWQTYSVGLRMVAPTSWGVARTGAVGGSSTTTWT